MNEPHDVAYRAVRIVNAFAFRLGIGWLHRATTRIALTLTKRAAVLRDGRSLTPSTSKGECQHPTTGTPST